jgi:hypothetical protein
MSMPLSTSDSRLVSPRAFAVLIAALAFFAVALEVGARIAVPRISQGIGRISTDLYAAGRFTVPVVNGRPNLLIVGNSLLLDGINREELQSEARSFADVQLLPIEGTTYFDWYFGLRRLFREGKRPAIVMLCINARQMLSNRTNRATFAYFLMNWSDLPEVTRASRLDMMDVSDYLLSHMSFWLATRANVRNGLVGRLIPASEQLVAHFTERDTTEFVFSNDLSARLLDRLGRLQGLAAEHGAEFIWLVPPTNNVADPSPAMAPVAAAAGINVSIPIRPGEMSVENYSDGFHLNAAGARVFTRRTIPEIERAVVEWRARRPAAQN